MGTAAAAAAVGQEADGRGWALFRICPRERERERRRRAGITQESRRPTVSNCPFLLSGCGRRRPETPSRRCCDTRKIVFEVQLTISIALSKKFRECLNLSFAKAGRYSRNLIQKVLHIKIHRNARFTSTDGKV